MACCRASAVLALAVRSSCLSMRIPYGDDLAKAQGRQLAGLAEISGALRLCASVGEMTAVVAVKPIEYEANDRPADKEFLGERTQVDEQQQATDDRKRTDDPGHRCAEWARAIGLLLAQYQYADRYHREREQST